MTELRHYAHDAEQAVIGALLQRPEAADRLGGLRPEHCYSQAHRVILACVLRMIAAGQPVDAVTVAEELDAAGDGERTGGLAYLGELAANTPSAANIHAYAAVVVGKALERQLLAAADTIRETVAGAGTTAEKLHAAQAAVMALTESAAPKAPRLAREALVDFVGTIMARHDGESGGLSTGFAPLDSLLTGGFRPGNLVILGGRPGSGKTAFALQLATNTAERQQTALVLSMEMAETEVMDRLIASLGRVPLDDVLAGAMAGESGERIMAASSRLAELPLLIDDQGGLSTFEVAAKARSVKRRHGLGLLVIDYLQLMRGDGDNRNQEITAISRGLKALAKELQVPVVALSQLSRKVEERTNKRPMMSDLRESGAIEQDADVILMMYRDEYYNPDSPERGTAEVVVAKNRQGRTGTARLAFIGPQVRFAELAPDWRPEQSFARPAAKRRGFDA